MPAIITIHLQPPTPLFFDEAWPLEACFLDILQRTDAHLAETSGQKDGPKPYALSPFWRDQAQRGLDSPELTTYHWRVCLLDDALRDPFLQGLEATETINLNGTPLTVGEAQVEERTYQDIAGKAQADADARPNRARHIGLQFITPVVLFRSGLPLPLPDPALVFRHYLSLWDTFAPRELWVNFNLLDAIQFHVAPTAHRLETRHVRWGDKGTRPGFLGGVTYTAHRWQKLGTEFLGNLKMLARFAIYCSTGQGTTRGLGQTRPLKGRPG
jgi:CRISPR-associated endoribonuclease Cas6